MPEKIVIPESHYMVLQTLARLRHAREILREVIPGYGISREDLADLVVSIEDQVQKVWSQIAIEEAPEE